MSCAASARTTCSFQGCHPGPPAGFPHCPGRGSYPCCPPPCQGPGISSLSSRIKTRSQEARRTGPSPEPRPLKRGDGRRKPVVPGAQAGVGTTGRGPESSFGLTRSTKAGSRLGVARCPSGRGDRPVCRLNPCHCLPRASHLPISA